MKKILLICAAIIFLAGNAWADTIIFKSGKKVEGTIREMTNDTITVDLYGVTDMTYPLSDLSEINGQPVDFAPKKGVVPAPAPETAESVSVVEEGNLPEMPRENMAASETPATPVPEVTNEPHGKPFSSGPVLNKKETAAFMAFLTAFLGILLVIAIIAYIYGAICLQIIAKKTGTQPAWLAWIPIANLFLMCKIGGVKYAWLLLILVGIVPFIGNFLAPICDLFLFGYLWYKIALARGKEGWIGAITIIPIIGLVTMGYLAFSGTTGPEKAGDSPAPPNIGGGQPANPEQDRPPTIV